VSRTCRREWGGRTPGRQGEIRAVEHETRLESYLGRAIGRATTPRGGAMVIATATTIATVGCGVLMTIIDKDFTTVGEGLWWAVQTVTTVGYGDQVPSGAAGKLVAALVMLFGLAFLAVVTAAITSSFVGRATEEWAKQGEGETPDTESSLREVHERLDRIEALLRQR
jgi:voltage-gated potassium channel